MIIVLLYFSPANILKILPIFVISFYIFYIFANKIIKKIGEERKKGLSQNKKNSESIGGIIEIISFKKEKYFGDIYDKYIYKLIEVFYKIHFFLKLPKIYFETLAIIGITVFSIIMLSTDTGKDEFIAILTIFIAISLRLLPSINKIVTNINTVRYCYPASFQLGIQFLEATLRKLQKNFKNFLKILNSIIFYLSFKNNIVLSLTLKLDLVKK